MRRSGTGRVLTVGLVLGSLLLGFLVSLQIVGPPFSVRPHPEIDSAVYSVDFEPDMSVSASVGLRLHNRIEAYKNGELVFAKEGDPWTLNLARLIKLLFFTYDGNDWPDVRPTAVRQPNRLTTVTSQITAFGYKYAVSTYAPVIGIGRGNAAPSINDVSLADTISLYDVIDPANVKLQDTGPYYWLNLSAQFTGLTETVREVGLFVRVSESTSVGIVIHPDQLFLLLLARDLISPPIDLAADDVLVVKYAIRIYKDVLVKNGFCDFVQVVFGLGAAPLAAAFPCSRVLQPGGINLPYPIFKNHPGSNCLSTSGQSPCVIARFVTSSITYTDRFLYSSLPPAGVDFIVQSPLTTITVNSTHIIIRTTLRYATSENKTIYGVVFYRNAWGNSYAGSSALLTYSAFTTQTVLITQTTLNLGYYAFSYNQGYPIMFILFNPPLSLPAYTKVQVILELAIPIS